MKKTQVASAGIAFVLAITFLLHAQTATLQSIQPASAESAVTVVADLEGLDPVPPTEWPVSATFWYIIPYGSAVPFPGPPSDPTVPVFSIASGKFLVDATGSQVALNPGQAGPRVASGRANAALAAQANAVENLIAQIQGLPMPGDGGDSGTNSYLPYGSSFVPPDYGKNLWLQFTGKTNSTAFLTIHNGVGVYDLFATTNLAPCAWQWVLRCAAGQTNLTVTNLTAAMDFFILGLTNDTDGGGLSDAYERLVLHTDPNNPNDDRLTPLVGIAVTDSVAVEQEATNTATFVLSRLGGYVGQPLTAACGISGTAVCGTDYTLAPGSVTGTNLSVMIPAGQTSVAVTLAVVNDGVTEGSETATLTLLTNAAWEVDTAHNSATAWILEDYTKVYTSNADFSLGVMDGLESVSNQLQFKTNLPPQFPFINVACSYRGTVARINTTNGMVMGEYATVPLGLAFTGDASGPGPEPSRTTVDEYGNVWIANRNDNRAINGTNYGSITHIGLIIGGTRYQKNSDGTYTTNALGQYVSLADATYNTCIDRDGDGYIRTSSGLADILPWNNDGGVDSNGGVSTADDEAITEYTRVPCTGTRTIAVDKFNDIWVGGHMDHRTHLKVNGLTGSVVPNSAFDANAGGYGGVIDTLGNLWSSDNDSGYAMRLVPPTNLPPTTNDWQILSGATSGYGIAVDPVHPYIWQTYPNYVFRWNTNGTPVTNADGTLQEFYSGAGGPKGLAVDANGHVWVAHSETSSTVGHLDTNGAWLGDVNLQVGGLWAEYFANTNLGSLPVLANVETSALDFSWTNGWPDVLVPTNQFSARWSGIVQPQTQGSHVFYVSAEAGAAFRLKVNGTTLIDHWTNPATNAVELSGTNWLGTNTAYDIKLEYVHFTNGAQATLSWLEPGMTNEEVIPPEQFQNFSSGPTGISIDAAGEIWAGCFNSSTAVRIDPNAGPMVVANGLTNHVGLVDMVVNLGDGYENDPHQPPYNIAASPYNYSDMTGFNERVVNPGFKPFKGYWMVTDDSGNAGQLWNKVSWNAALTNGCAIEVYVRAADDRNGLGSATFVPVTNNVSFPSIRGRYIEVRLGMTRDDTSKQPVLYDLTLYGASSGFAGDYFLDDARAYETQDATFEANIAGIGPMGYQWYRQYPWETNWVQVAGATNSTFTITNVDSWVDWTTASVLVTNGNGESLWFGPAYLEVWSLPIGIPASGSSGPASRYPATINIFGQPTNINTVAVSLWSLSHTRSADLNFLLLSPSGKRIILMSNVGGINGVTGASLRFLQGWSPPLQSGAIPSGLTSTYGPSNYGQKTPQAPFGLSAGPYSSNLGDLQGDDPNGVWKLYIYDDVQPNGVGEIYNSWSLDFTFQ